MRTDRIYSLAVGALAISMVAVTWARDPVDPEQWVLIQEDAPECPDLLTETALDEDETAALRDDARQDEALDDEALDDEALDDDARDDEDALDEAYEDGCEPLAPASHEAWNLIPFEFFAMNGGVQSFASSVDTGSSGSSSSGSASSGGSSSSGSSGGGSWSSGGSASDGDDQADPDQNSADDPAMPTIIDDTVEEVVDDPGLGDGDGDGFGDAPAMAESPINDGGEVLDALTSGGDDAGGASGGSTPIDVADSDPASLSAVPAPPALVLLLGALAALGAARKRSAG